MSFDKKDLPQYKLKDEIPNSITHGIGALFALGVLIYFLVKEIAEKIPFIKMGPFYFYVFSMLIVFVVSTLYHSSKFNSKYRVVMRIIDHSDIYLFVAGTYFPICMSGIAPFSYGIAMMIIEFAIALYGILVNSIPNNSKFLRISAFIMYVIQGWLLLFFLPFGIQIAPEVFWPILGGGIVYTIGAVLYAIGKKKIYFHTIFHIFVLLGAVVQFIGIFFLLG